ncbi:AMP-binding protein [Paenactinomyces guangxiensis]|uniref:AMP-binding protein n=1 Tax=Paenactinomyces guangxiensis TaxID=1490290 RepID=A0A7W2A7J2_9BACL|nr:AMP-binding protein [Paenactinomyces guangxiensis]MBA4493174.1 AMP-binding protein [Paenactinomyces guangxiensis]MBH8589976.1 AMP-binding protein [Paenactinomyces guangxiensis]
MAELINITVGSLLDRQAEKVGEKEAVVYPELGLRWTYKEFQSVCNQAAKGLMRLGLDKGHHLSIWATNQPEWLITQFATGKMGAVLITVNTNYRTRELEYLLSQSDTETLILMEQVRGTSYVDMLFEICPELNTCAPGQLKSERLPRLKNVILLGEKRYPGMFLWKDMIEMGAEMTDEKLYARQQSLSPDDVINMQYTSGTTGFPKGVMLTHYNIVNNARNIAECMNLTPADRLCIPVPFFHCFGCVLGTLACASVGATMIPLTMFEPGAVLNAVEQEKCTGLHGVPTMFISELNHPDFANTDFSTLRTGIMAGSNCPIEVMRRVTGEMGITELTIAYGQTESSPVITQTKTDDPIEIRVATVGKRLPGVEVKIIDPQTGKEVPPGVQGELCTRGYHVMKGYYKMPEATAEAIDGEGWLHTGDLAVQDEQGYFKITGRLKDMIIRGGENIYPREIEEFLYTHPKILDVQIVGVPDEKYGEIPIAFVIKKEEVQLTEEEVINYCVNQIAKYKIPAQVIFLDQYPMTASGKIQKYKLREQYVNQFSKKQ